MKKSIYLFVVLLGLWVGFLFGRRSGEKQSVGIIKTDTLTNVQIKTVKYDEPKLICTKFDDIHLTPIPQLPDFAPKKFVADFDFSSFAPMREVKIYQDSTYMAQVSGIDVQLDWIETYNITKEITVREQIQVKPKKWSLYAFGEAEISAVPDCKVGLGASFTQNRWTIGLDAGKKLIRNENFVRINAKFAFARF